MKYCPNCQQWNHGKPIRCRYCSRTWNVKLCSLGHVNPIDANYCGECGRAELSEPAGTNSLINQIISLFKYVKVLILAVTIVSMSVSIFQNGLGYSQIAIVLSIALLLVVLTTVNRILGNPIKVSYKSISSAAIKVWEWIAS